MNIIAKDVSVSIQSQQIIENIRLHVSNHEFVGLIGPNGSGKSTLLKCIYRILKPDTGYIELNGRRLDEMTYRESALQMAVVAQHNTYNFDFTVMDILLMGRAPHKKFLQRNTPNDYAIAQKALQRVQLNGFENRIFSSLSGGEQQRVILARALTQETECLILDEPTNHLDITHQLNLLDTIKELGITVLSAIHDLNLAAMYCDRLIAINQKHVVAEGTPKEVLTEEFIRKIYKVNSSVIVNPKTQQVSITFIPKHVQ